MFNSTFYVYLFVNALTMKAFFRTIAAASKSEGNSVRSSFRVVRSDAICYSCRPNTCWVSCLRACSLQWLYTSSNVYDLGLEMDYLYQRESLFLFVCSLHLADARQPFKYGFEGMMVNEFHTLDVVCTNLVPQGPGYENITLENQVCTTVGAIPGEPTVKGIRFTDLALGYTYNHLWRVSHLFNHCLFHSFLTPKRDYLGFRYSGCLWRFLCRNAVLVH